MTVSPESLLAALRWRYATKRFEPGREIPAATWDALEESLVLTPSSFGLQPWKFLVIDDPAVRAALFAESWNQTQVTDASRYLVLAARTGLDAEDIDAWMDRLVHVQGSSAAAVAPLKDMIVNFVAAMPSAARHAWNVRQTYIALGQLMASAALLGIDACPMEGIDPAAYDRVLGLAETGHATVVACALGYRAPGDRSAALPKARFERSRVIAHL